MKTYQEIHRQNPSSWNQNFSKKLQQPLGQSSLVNGSLILQNNIIPRKIKMDGSVEDFKNLNPRNKKTVPPEASSTESSAINILEQRAIYRQESDSISSTSSSASESISEPSISPLCATALAMCPEDEKPPLNNHEAGIPPLDIGGGGGDKGSQRVTFSWWERRNCGGCEFKSGREKTLWLWIFVLSIISSGLLVSLMTMSVKWKDETAGVCITQECVITAEKVLSSLDTTIDPCIDFFNYSCGGWISKNPIPESSSNWDQFDILREKMNIEIKNILEKDPVLTDPEAVLLAQKLYRMCMAQSNADNHTELQRLADRMVSTGPGEKLYDIGTKLGRIRRELNGNYLISMYVFYDEKEPTKSTIYIDAPSFGIAKPHFQDNASVKAYQDLIADIWEYVYPDSEEPFQKVAQDIVQFEKQLAQIATPMEKRRNRTSLYNPMLLHQLTQMLPRTDSNWTSYFQQIFLDAESKIDWTVQKIIVKDLRYFLTFGTVLEQSRFTTIRNYLKWRMLFQLGTAASSKIQQRVFQYTKTTIGVQFPPPTWKICALWVNRNMGWAVSYRYVQTNFRTNFKHEVSAIVKDIRDGFFQILQEADWIGETTKEIAFRKAEAMRSFIAYPEWLLNNRTALNAEFRGLINGTFDTSHFNNFVAVTKWAAGKALRELEKEKDYSTWISYSTMVNAFYSASYNAIAFPAGILQKPFYGYPLQSMNYGGIGAVIGHEITHAFDDEGSQSDEKGQLVNWWDAETLEKYSAKAKCFVNQYGNFTIPGLNITLNGINTQGENIADNGGLHQAFRGYQAFVKRNGVEDRLPGIDFSPDQLFFIAFAQSLCGSFRLKYLEQYIKTSRHSPWQYQVQGSVANSLDFAKTWKCPLRKEPCQIW